MLTVRQETVDGRTGLKWNDMLYILSGIYSIFNTY